MSVPAIVAFLIHLTVKEKVSAATQNQACKAILFLYRTVWGVSLEDQKIAAIPAGKKKKMHWLFTANSANISCSF